ncbi:hypothetical protein CAEBREN_07955 [Caenorhabditis brenneri]|uniref:Switch protein XOL-1 N-terminal domain-containing protein n=1 Tax=Caenorhabditis brenneri TaxID=135651 RepID=G0MW86_CAEBE|nr:hypothetical protein CAEBREN_07955 [Caenorhabditis brenneri]
MASMIQGSTVTSGIILIGIRFLDYFNEVSPLAVLVSIWKNLQGREPEIGDTERLESVLFAVLDEFNIKIDARKTVLTATLEGSKEQFHIRPKSGDGDKITRVPNKWFFKTCSMSTIVTNVEMTPEKTPFLPDDVLIAELEDCFNSATDDLKIRKSVSEIGKIMRRFSDARMELRSGNNENIVFDIDMDVGISKFETANETSGNINGHEIKTNGGLCLYNGENYWRQTLTFFVNTSEILKQTNEVIEFIMFELILPSAGAVFNPAWGSSEPTHRAVLKLQKLPEKVVDPKVYPQVITVNPDKKPTGATEATGEPSAKRGRPDHDDTYDGSDDSMA